MLGGSSSSSSGSGSGRGSGVIVDWWIGGLVDWWIFFHWVAVVEMMHTSAPAAEDWCLAASFVSPVSTV